MTHTTISPLPGLTLRVGLNRRGRVNKAGVRKVKAALKGLTPGEAMLVQAAAKVQMLARATTI